MLDPEPRDCLESTHFIDFDDPSVRAFAERCASGGGSDVDVAVRVYYAVRDGLRYDPYSALLSEDGLRASSTLASGKGWCVAKAVLLAACYRGLGLPARLGFADVRNHLSTARMRESMKTDVFYWHGYTSVWLEGRWVKATPAFNVELCTRFGFLPLEFDGRNDSLYHPFDGEGKQHMEYVNERGEYADVPLAAIKETFEREYPQMMGPGEGQFARADFAADVEAEAAGSGDSTT